MKEDDWGKAMSTIRKVLPVSLDVTPRPLPESLTIRAGKSELTRARMKVLDGNGKVGLSYLHPPHQPADR